MAKSIRDIPKKTRGRPSTGGRGEGIMVRWQPSQMRELDRWIAKQHDPFTRPEAIRRLVEMGLQAEGEARRTSGARSGARAAELAKGVIDSRMPADATPDERQTRKERLLKGPSTFRDVRKDRSK